MAVYIHHAISLWHAPVCFCRSYYGRHWQRSIHTIFLHSRAASVPPHHEHYFSMTLAEPVRPPRNETNLHRLTSCGLPTCEYLHPCQAPALAANTTLRLPIITPRRSLGDKFFCHPRYCARTVRDAALARAHASSLPHSSPLTSPYFNSQHNGMSTQQPGGCLPPCRRVAPPGCLPQEETASASTQQDPCPWTMICTLALMTLPDHRGTGNHHTTPSTPSSGAAFHSISPRITVTALRARLIRSHLQVPLRQPQLQRSTAACRLATQDPTDAAAYPRRSPRNSAHAVSR